MKNLKLLFFGKFSGRISNITICKALDDLTLKDPRFLENRENCIHIDEVFDNLEYDLGFLDIVIDNIEYLYKTEEFKFPIFQNNKKLGIVLIDKFGSARVMYDTLQAIDFDSNQLEKQIRVLLDSSRGELIDSLMTILQFTRPIPLSTDMFLLNISDADEEYVVDFFNQIFENEDDNNNRPYFIHLENSPLNVDTISCMIANKMNEVLKAFNATKNEYYDGLAEDMSVEDINIIDRLISLTKEDINFYEKSLNCKIFDKLDTTI